MTLTMSSTTFAVIQAGATPVFADICEDTFLIDPKSIERNITDKTKAVIPVSLYGLMPRMDEIMEIASRHNIFVLEDDAECVGGRYKGIQAGNYGNASSFSFQSSKHLSAGEGGIVVTDDLKLAEAIRRVSSLGYAGVGANKGKITKKDIQDPNYSRHVSMGWNYRISELCAAVALAQVERADELVKIRSYAGEKYLNAVKSCEWLIPQHTDKNSTNSFWTFAVKINLNKVGWNKFRDKFLEFGGDGIYAAWKLTYLEPMFETMSMLGRENKFTRDKEYYSRGLCKVAEYIQPRLLQFKTNYWDEEDIDKQVEILRKTIEYFDR